MSHTNYKQMIEKIEEVINDSFEILDSNGKGIEQVKEFLKSSYIKSLNNEIEYLESKLIKWTWFIHSVYNDDSTFRSCNTCCWLENDPESCHICEIKNEVIQDHISYLLEQRKLIEEN